MTATLDETLAGADMVGGEVFCDDLYNNLKNHWRADYAGDPCAVLTEQPGMIISDAHDDRLYHITTGPACTEIVQGDIPISDEVAVIFGDGSDGLIYYDEAANNELVIEAKNAANVEGVTINLLETNQRFRIRQNADYITMYLDGSHAFFSWSDGHLNLHTDEDDTNTQVHIHGNGAGYGQLFIYDEDDAEFLELDAIGGAAIIRTGGVAPAQLALQDNIAQNITCWETIVAGNPYFYLYGWNTAGGARRYTRFQMSDVNDEFLIEAENSVNHGGITISLTETNQRFRVRQNADYMAMYLDGSNAFLTWSDGALNLQTEETNINSVIAVHGNGTGYGRFNVYDEDDAEYLQIHATTGYGDIRVRGAAPAGLRLQYQQHQGITCWLGITEGNPYFYLYGWNTAAGAVVYSRFQMSDTNDEFLIEAENSVNHEGITVSLLEEYQKFRIRGTAGFLGFEVTPNAPIGTNLMALWDPDFDSNIAFLWEADDKPKIDTGGNAEGIIMPICADDETKTNNYNILVTDFGKTLIMNAIDKTFSLPSVGASDIGAILTFVFISTGILIIDAADNDTIDDSGAGDTIYCTQNGEKYSTIKLMLATATEWVILAAKGIWTTTE